MELIYDSYSVTIRQMPQNYLIAHKAGNDWICAPDLAADRNLCVEVFTALLEYDNKYAQTGEKLLENIQGLMALKQDKIKAVHAIIESEVPYFSTQSSVKNFVEENYDRIKAIIIGNK